MIFTMNVKDKNKKVVTETWIEPTRPQRQLSAGAADVEPTDQKRPAEGVSKQMKYFQLEVVQEMTKWIVKRGSVTLKVYPTA